MDDLHLRQLARTWRETGDLTAGVAWLSESIRSGEVFEEEVRVRAYMGEELARHVLGADRPTRYDALPRFVERWFAKPLAPDYGPARARLAEIEEEHGPLSAALREWVILTWGRHWAGYNQDWILGGADRFDVRNGKVSLFVENQGNFSYSCDLSDQDQDDPPTLVDGELPGVASSSESLLTGLIWQTCWNGAEPGVFEGSGFFGPLAEGVVGRTGSAGSFAALGERYSLLAGPLAP